MPPLAVGQVWVVHRQNDRNGYWCFHLVAETVWEGQTYYVGLKCGAPPNSHQAVIFDRQGRTVEGRGPFRFYFVCHRLSRGKHQACLKGKE